MHNRGKYEVNEKSALKNPCAFPSLKAQIVHLDLYLAILKHQTWHLSLQELSWGTKNMRRNYCGRVTEKTLIGLRNVQWSFIACWEQTFNKNDFSNSPQSRYLCSVCEKGEEWEKDTLFLSINHFVFFSWQTKCVHISQCVFFNKSNTLLKARGRADTNCRIRCCNPEWKTKETLNNKWFSLSCVPNIKK